MPDVASGKREEIADNTQSAACADIPHTPYRAEKITKPRVALKIFFPECL